MSINKPNSNPTSSIILKLKQLKLSHAAYYYEAQYLQSASPQINTLQLLEDMLEHEISSRRNNHIHKLIKNAKFRHTKAQMEDVDYGSNRINPDVIAQLLQSDWMGRHRSVIITGATGTGKTWLACALGNDACRNLKKVLFVQAADLYEDILFSIADGSITKAKQKYCKAELLIIDDFGIGELLPQICPVLLDIIDKQSTIGGLMITSQYPIEIWHSLFPEATIADAILDRIIHRAYPITLTGESMRKRLMQAMS